MEVFEDHQERLDLGLLQEQTLDRVQRPLPALRWVEGLPLGIIVGHIQKGEERRERRLPGAVPASRRCRRA